MPFDEQPDPLSDALDFIAKQKRVMKEKVRAVLADLVKEGQGLNLYQERQILGVLLDD